jgi:hypothetical protein
MARQCSSLTVTVKLIKSALDTSDHNTLWNDSEEAGNFSSKCEELESTDRPAGQFKNNEGGESDTDWKKQFESDMF